MRRLFLDANLLFTAAHNPCGKAAFVIQQAAEGYWQIFTSDYAVEEARRNLERKFPNCLNRFEALTDPIPRVPWSPRSSLPVSLHEKDRPILAAALDCHATHLLTGDLRHFGPFMNAPERTGGVLIQMVAEFLASI